LRVGRKPLKRPKKGLFGPFKGPYGGIPKVFGEGPRGVLKGRKKAEEEKRVKKG